MKERNLEDEAILSNETALSPPAAFKKTGADRVPAEAGNVYDTESNSKMVQDLQNQLKSLFYENKQVNKQV